MDSSTVDIPAPPSSPQITAGSGIALPEYVPMDREPHTQYRVWLIEKLIINFALPSDFVYHSFRAVFQKDRSQTTYERLKGLWQGKVVKYQKLLRVKDENGGTIPPDYQELCRQTPCGKVRLFLATYSYRRQPKKSS